MNAIHRYLRLLSVLLLALSVAGLAGCSEPEESPPVAEPDVVDAQILVDVVEDVPPPVELPVGWCDLDAECAPDDLADLPMCKTYGCVDNVCSVVPIEDGLTCDDGDACSLEDTCVEGACVGTPLDCDDENSCTTDGCDPDHGCVSTYNQKPCDDGDECTVEDACFQGKCTGTALSCNDGNPCTDDECVVTSGCVWSANDDDCDDGSTCTDGDTCVEGTCVPGPALECQVANPCIEGTCDPVTGCVETLLDEGCDDIDACTKDDTCVVGTCTGVPVVCDDGNPCTSDYCDAVEGCKAAPTTDACDYGDPCTINDKCAQSICVPGGPNPECCVTADTCEDQDSCTVEGCDDDGFCTYTPMDCGDGEPCTVDVCTDGTCSTTAVGALGAGLTLVDGFEAGGLSGWTTTSTNAVVGWQADAMNIQAGGLSAYCGKTPEYSYDFGTTTADLSRWVSVPSGAPALTFWILQDVAELLTCNHDVTRVLVNGVVVHEICSSLPAWTLQTVDLTAWQGMSIELTFQFDTVDEQANNGLGVWIDQVQVAGVANTECCGEDTDCSDGALCTDTACHMATYQCTVPTGDEACDDGDVCTLDSCDGAGQCANAGIAGCCGVDADCPGDEEFLCATGVCLEGSTCGLDETECCTTASDCVDADTCTTDTCGVDGFCDNAAIQGCCGADADCGDGEACTVDTCVGNVCSNAPIAGCCGADADCGDGEACTADVCAGGVCSNPPVPGCCDADSDCGDGDACTLDFCDGGVCSNAPIPGCCDGDADCDDGDFCTVNVCDPVGSCVGEIVQGCCHEDADCDDSVACTDDLCVANSCTNTPIDGCVP